MKLLSTTCLLYRTANDGADHAHVAQHLEEVHSSSATHIMKAYAPASIAQQRTLVTPRWIYKDRGEFHCVDELRTRELANDATINKISYNHYLMQNGYYTIRNASFLWDGSHFASPQPYSSNAR